MRHVRTRRRFKFILIGLLSICIILFFEKKIEAFVPHIKNFAEARIDDTLGGRFRISIGAIDGGIMHPFILSDIRIRNDKDAVLFPYIVINNIKTNYRLWDILLSGREDSFLYNFLPADSRIYVNFVSANRDLSGFVMLKGDLADSNIKGYVNIKGLEKIDFEGKVKDDDFDIEIKPHSGAINIKGNISDEGNITLTFKINHIKLYGFDIVCEGSLTNLITDSLPKRGMEGEIDTGNLIINYKPFLDMRLFYTISDGIMDISEMTFGESFKAAGKIALKNPYNIDMKITANNVSIAWLLSTLGSKDPSSVLSGTMNGKFALTGPVTNLKSDINLDIKKGTISVIDFDYLAAHLKGEGPVIRIEDSRITRESGYFVLAGEMDLAKLGKESLFDDIKLVSDDKAITWDGWGATKAQGVQKITMTKKLSDDINIDFKKFMAEEKIDESIRDNDEVQLEYKLHPHESLKLMVGQDKDFLGFEHKDKF